MQILLPAEERRARPSRVGALAPRAWHWPATARTKAVARFGHIEVQARQQAALAQAIAAREAVLDRLQWQVAELRANLEKIAQANAGTTAEL